MRNIASMCIILPNSVLVSSSKRYNVLEVSLIVHEDTDKEHIVVIRAFIPIGSEGQELLQN